MRKFLFFFLLIVAVLNAHTLHITDHTCFDKEDVVTKVLELQSSWQVNIREPQDVNTSLEGFLFIRMTPAGLLDLLDIRKAQIIWAEEEGEFLGYLILTPMDEFFDLYINSPIRTFDCKIDHNIFLQEGLLYIEQIAVRKQNAHQGIASSLLDVAKQLAPKGLVAAVLTEPFANLASLNFFLKNGFTQVGFLNCIECPEWPAYQTTILIHLRATG